MEISVIIYYYGNVYINSENYHFLFRSNFPSAASFHDFKKQRDRFYTLVRRWGERSGAGGGLQGGQLAGEVEAVAACWDHPANYQHFARLFLAQVHTQLQFQYC